MDPILWQQLPEELRERVLTFLPLKSLFRFRGVCKHWRKLVHSSQFRRTWSEINKGRQCQNPWLIRIDNGSSHVHVDLVSCELASEKCYSDPEPRIFSTSTTELTVPGIYNQVSASGGLICYNSKLAVQILCPSHPRRFFSAHPPRSVPSDQESGIFVCNPVTQATRQLPPLQVVSCPISYQSLYPRELGIAVDTRSSTSQIFRVIVIGISNDCSRNAAARTSPLTAVYDSSMNSWSLSDHWLPDMIKPVRYNRYSMGRLHYFADRSVFYDYRQFTYRDYSTRFEGSDIFNSVSNFAVAAYDVKEMVWKRVVRPNGRQDRIYPVQSHNSSRLLVITNADNMLDSCRNQTVKLPVIPDLLARSPVTKTGNMTLVGSNVTVSTLYGPSLFQVWELVHNPDQQPEWKLLLAIATEYRSKLWGGCWCPWTFFDHCYMPDDNTIWVFITYNPQVECFQNGFSLVLVCDLPSKSLRWLNLKMSRDQASTHPESTHKKLFLFNPRLEPLDHQQA